MSADITFNILANDTVTPAVVLIGGATITPVWTYSDEDEYVGLNGYSGGGKAVTNGMTLELDCEGHPEEIQQIVLTGDPFGFDLSALAQFTGLTHILGSGDANALYTGTLSDLPASVTGVSIQATASVITGALADLPAGMLQLKLQNTSSIITGTVAALPAGMQVFDLSGTTSTITGTLSDLPSTLNYFVVGVTTSTVTGGATAVPALAIRSILLNNTTMTEAQVDSVCLRLYTDRATFTYATPALKIGGTNPAPSYIGNKHSWVLANDPDSEGFNTWAITPAPTNPSRSVQRRRMEGY